MNPIRSIAEAYKRWRHSYGFGVHSPFAYELIKSSITPGKYAYYGYWDIDKAILHPGAKVYPSLRKDARLLLRLLINLRSSSLLLPKGSHPVFATVAKAAGIQTAPRHGEAISPKSQCTKQTPLLLLTRNTLPKSGEAARRTKEGISILAFDPTPQLRSEIKSAMTDGLILEGTRTLLVVPRPEMAQTYYSVRI